MNKIRIFENEQFGKVRTLEENGKVLFCGSDIAKALGYKRPNEAISAHCKGTVKRRTLTNGGLQELLFITEGDIYRLTAHSRLPSAERFESWIFDEVLPTIHRTGGYVGDADMFVENYLPFADEPIKQLFRLQMEVIGQLNDRIRHDEPLVEFANQVADTSNCIDVGTFAKLAFGEKSNFGRTNMFKWLKKRKFLTFNNIPYQKYIDAGYFVVKETFFIKNGEKKNYQQTLVTGKGQVYLMGKLREDFDIL